MVSGMATEPAKPTPVQSELRHTTPIDPTKKDLHDQRDSDESDAKKLNQKNFLSSTTPISLKLSLNDFPRSPASSGKRARTAYNFYCSYRRKLLKREYPSYSSGDISRIVGKEWRSLSATEKLPYEELSGEEKNLLG